jgi:hypothetical protein
LPGREVHAASRAKTSVPIDPHTPASEARRMSVRLGARDRGIVMRNDEKRNRTCALDNGEDVPPRHLLSPEQDRKALDTRRESEVTKVCFDVIGSASCARGSRDPPGTRARDFFQMFKSSLGIEKRVGNRERCAGRRRRLPPVKNVGDERRHKRGYDEETRFPEEVFSGDG